MKKIKKVGNMELLRELITRSGMSLTNVAKALNITYISLNNKLKGEFVFTLDEALQLKKLLDLTQSEWNAIFDEDA